jgi:hypothetical protein
LLAPNFVAGRIENEEEGLGMNLVDLFLIALLILSLCINCVSIAAGAVGSRRLAPTPFLFHVFSHCKQ